jgi:N-acetylglucosamine-6-phosphate deacetylase
LLGDTKASDVILRGGTVEAVRRPGTAKPDIGSVDTVIAPTLFDIQVNGFAGVSLQGSGVGPEDVLAVTEKLAALGVSHWIPTLITASQKDLEHGCRVLAEAMQNRAVARAVPGIHLEGPYISPVDGPRGAHPKRHVRKPSVREFDQLIKAANGKIAYVTIAPEVPGAVSFIRAMGKRNVLVALGHHDADEAAINKAVEAGARLCTHLGNGMKAEIPRHTNPLWPQLANDGLTAAFIPDLQHLPAPALKTLLRAKGIERTVLTSDVVHIAGLKPGKHTLAGADVELLPSGRICLSGTAFLAGSSLALLQGVVNAARVTDLTLEQAFACATSTPARLFGLRHRFELPKKGKKASFVAFNIDKTKKDWRTTICSVFIRGDRKL